MPRKKKKPQQTQSVKMLRQHMHELFVKGSSLKEISEIYAVDLSYIYKILGEIAKDNGVEREFYLTHPQKKSQEKSRNYNSNNTYKHYKEEEFECISDMFITVENDIAVLLKQLKKININNDCEELK